MTKAVGGLLMGCGILIALASGLCIVTFAATSNAVDLWIMLMILGGIPLCAGIFLIWAGRRVIRNADIPSVPPNDTFQ